jgi:predicted transcriptional regulator
MFLGRYRSRVDIVSQILVSAKEIEGVTKTRIMFKAYLSFAQTKEYLKLLIDNGLLEHIAETNTYRTTAKGLAMLEACENVNKLIGEVRA